MIITKELLEGTAKKHIENYTQKNLFNEDSVINSTGECDIFISHSYLDKELILTLVQLFKTCGYSVYVDWINDAELDRNNVNTETAEIVRSRIAESNSLAYVVTTNIADSKWCPWELGLADGLHNRRACILPILSEGDTFKGQEYLGTYPYIDYAQIRNTNKYQFWINDQSDPKKYINLRDWLKGKVPHEHQ